MQEENTVKKNIEKIIRTYTSDMARVMKEKETSVIKIAVAQKEKEGAGIIKIGKNTIDKKNKDSSKILFVIGGVILIIIAVFGFYYLKEKKLEIDNPIIENTDPETKISYDVKSYLTISNITTISDIVNFITTEKTKTEKERSIKSIFINRITEESGELSNIKTLDFLSIIKTSAPSPLLRSLSDNFMTGIFYKTNSQHLFIILETTNYNQAYASMLSWEKTLLDDMINLFNIKIENKKILENKWKDVIINNKDVRIIHGEDGQGILYYLFLDKTTLLITDDVDTIKEIITRFQIK
ncbi:TPA: hypothetical protein DIC38_00895 [Candidatus Nomurabacteria bacterium]|nr:MAG: hypothetical protein O210_OD1C00001G0548 [Parcubacteria bacterium RAAC4_OD1_1]HCY26229.1 hypothetical protein [Candidatus Nomurabacteria bacterium]